MFIKFVKYVLLFSAFEYNFSSIPKIVFTLPEKTEPIEYTTCKDINEMEEFFSCCENADTIEIIDQTVPETGDIICDIVKQLVVNIEKFSDPEKNKKHDVTVNVTLFAWMGTKLLKFKPQANFLCATTLNSMAPKDHDKAKLLLLSQSDQYIPDLDANWNVIGHAINILQKSRDTRSQELLKFLSTLTDERGRRIYAAILEPIGEVQ